MRGNAPLRPTSVADTTRTATAEIARSASDGGLDASTSIAGLRRGAVLAVCARTATTTAARVNQRDGAAIVALPRDTGTSRDADSG
jgi:hypothetical protein